MKVSKISFNGNFNIGLFGFATDSFCLVGNDILDKDLEVIKKTLGVPVHQISIAGTSLIGVFVVGNSKKILVPKITFVQELEHLSSLGIDYEVIDSNFTALGNNIVCNDNGAIVNPEMEKKAIDQISNALGVKVQEGTIEKLNNVGSLSLCSNLGCIVSKDAQNSETERISEVLGVSVSQGTINLGSNYLHSGVVFNSKGFLVGSVSGGVEITDVDDALSGKNE